MREAAPRPEQENRKEQWLAELSDFLAESYEHGWASGAEKITDPETGEKTLVYARDDWQYVDTYSGYFAAPGETKVFYKDRHVWSMSYGGDGQSPEHYGEVRETFEFLKEALQAFDPMLPLRGPVLYADESNTWEYACDVKGDVDNATWVEEVSKWTGNPGEGEIEVYFSQVGTCGIIIDKDENYNPIYPWDIADDAPEPVRLLRDANDQPYK